MVSVITFDADGTLCDFPRLMAAALAAALANSNNWSRTSARQR